MFLLGPVLIATSLWLKKKADKVFSASPCTNPFTSLQTEDSELRLYDDGTLRLVKPSRRPLDLIWSSVIGVCGGNTEDSQCGGAMSLSTSTYSAMSPAKTHKLVLQDTGNINLIRVSDNSILWNALTGLDASLLQPDTGSSSNIYVPTLGAVGFVEQQDFSVLLTSPNFSYELRIYNNDQGLVVYDLLSHSPIWTVTSIMPIPDKNSIVVCNTRFSIHIKFF